MCTWIVQIVFVAFLVIGAAMTIIALVTPGWKEFHNNQTVSDSAIHTGKDFSKDYTNYKIVVGFFSSACGDGGWDACQDYVKNQIKNAPDWKKAAMSCLILSLAACAAAFVWSCVACFMCCCKSCLTPPLPIFAGLACVLDIIGIIIYGVKSGEELGNAPTSYGDLQSKSTFGYSFWVGIGAIAALFVDTLVGVVLVKTSKVSPI